MKPTEEIYCQRCLKGFVGQNTWSRPYPPLRLLHLVAGEALSILAAN
jgi:hypothetical protein